MLGLGEPYEDPGVEEEWGMRFRLDDEEDQ